MLDDITRDVPVDLVEQAAGGRIKGVVEIENPSFDPFAYPFDTGVGAVVVHERI